MSCLGFPRSSRLLLNKEFERVLRGGRRTSAEGLELRFSTPPLAGRQPRLGIIVSKKAGGAVARARAKRLIREVFRLNRHRLKEAADLIVRPRTFEKLDGYANAEKAISLLWKKSGLLDENIG
ncbi:MAG TPA: ribonuclease P protein component [Elusimicrobiales bacterium]|nr:ribonuclease P protein component [Elusimicrobiales bacterium]